MNRSVSRRGVVSTLFCLSAFWFSCSYTVAIAQSPPSLSNAVDGAPATDTATRVRELRATDPAAAIALAEPGFKQAVGAERVAIGLELAESLVVAKRNDEAKSVLDVLALDPDLGAAGRAPLARMRLQIAMASSAWDDVDPIAATVEGIVAATENRLARAELWSQLGMVRLARSRFVEAETAYRQALDAAGENDSPLRFEALQKLGVALAQQGRYPDALESFSRAEAVGSRIGLGDDPNFLLRYAGVFLYTEDPAHAIQYLNRALAAVDADPARPANRIAIYNNLGTAYYGQKDYEQAAHWFETSLAHAREHGGNIGHALNNLGAVLREWGRDGDALEKFEEARRLAVADDDQEGLAVAEKNVGETLIKLGQRARAVAPLERAYAIYAKSDQRPKRLELYPVMIDNLDALGREREALQLMREYKTLSDDVVNVESRERISKLESAIDLAQKQKQLAATERDNAVKSAAIEQLESQRGLDQKINRGMIFAIAVLAILIILQIRDRVLKARVHRQLTSKSEKIEMQRRALESLNDVVRRQSLEDVLTGLKNRRYLTEWMAEANQRRAEDGSLQQERGTGLFIMIDLDHFKAINDRFGHAAGDHVLAEFAAILHDCRRESDQVVRWGGEEFVWVCPNTPVNAGPLLCNRIRDTLIARNIIIDDVAIGLTVSMGFAPNPIWPGQAADWQLTMRVADAALYEAKSAGRDRWLGYAPGTTPDTRSAAGGDVAELEANGQLRRIVMEG